MIALPATSLAQAQTIALRTCAEVEQRLFQTMHKPLHMTISIGLAHSEQMMLNAQNGQNPLIDLVVAEADHALLASKQAGRNMVTLGRTAA